MLKAEICMVEIGHSAVVYLRIQYFYFQIDYEEIWKKIYLFPLSLEFFSKLHIEFK